ncbi:hypothetical protein [Asticcacaulis sp. AC466]|uniref:hypothetical protein n=1 Tax=Asticcacaulis sp. AC466 TaxID=1282362 RepID=UPI000421AE22|nr:hypothetical protein [Asticcacaulis sp. AC466]
MTKQKATHIRELDFVAVNELNQITSMWSVEPCGNYGRDNELGRTYGAECLEFISRTNDPTLLGKIIRDMIKGGRYDAVEIGFMYMVSAYVISVPYASGESSVEQPTAA